MTDSTVVFHAGDVHSSVDPFATAIAFSGSQVSWVGEDEAALTMSGEHVDLAGDFLAPGFVHAGLLLGEAPAASADPAADPAVLLRAGITTVHVLGAPEAVAAFRAAAPDELSVVDYVEGEGGGRRMIRAADLDAAALSHSGALFITVEDSAQLVSVLESLADPQVRTRAQRGLWRLLMRCPVDPAHITALAATGIGTTLDPAAGQQPLGPLMSAGAQLSFALDPQQPWKTLAAAVFRSEQGVSARAAFNAATRFGFRAVGSFEGGVLAPGAPATAVRWEVGELVVQVADERLAAWSTDPRSGTPGLPDLSGESPLPAPHSVWVRGVRF